MSEILELLSNNDTAFSKIKLLSGQSIQYKGWNVESEKNFLYAIDGINKENDELVTNEVIKLMGTSVDAKEKLKDLSKNDLLYLLYEMRLKAKGNKIEMSYRCTNQECPTWMKLPKKQAEKMGIEGIGRELLTETIILDKDVVTKPLDQTPIVIRDNLKLYPKEVSFEIQRVLENKYIKGDEETAELQKFKWEFMINSIKGVEFGDKKEDNLDKTYVEKILFRLEPKERDLLETELGERISQFKLNKKGKCNGCGKESNLVPSDMFRFLVF